MRDVKRSKSGALSVSRRGDAGVVNLPAAYRDRLHQREQVVGDIAGFICDEIGFRQMAQQCCGVPAGHWLRIRLRTGDYRRAFAQDLTADPQRHKLLDQPAKHPPGVEVTWRGGDVHLDDDIGVDEQRGSASSVPGDWDQDKMSGYPAARCLAAWARVLRSQSLARPAADRPSSCPRSSALPVLPSLHLLIAVVCFHYIPAEQRRVSC